MEHSLLRPDILQKRERIFFLAIAVAIVVAVVSGFGLFFLAGFSSFDAPLSVHIHAVTFMIWVFFYLAQNALVFRNNLVLHRKFGWFGTGLVAWVVLVGLVTTYLSATSGHTPPIFTPASLFALNLMMILTFAVLASAAIWARKQTDWHRRLMLCATICVIAPAFGRLLILLGVRTHLNFMLVILSWIAVAAAFDLVAYRKVHAAYAWGFGAIIVMGLAIQFLPVFPPFVSLADGLAGK